MPSPIPSMPPSSTAFTVEEMRAGELLAAREWSFVLSAPSLDVLPPADRPEIAFAGRSNVGKSSLLNALVRRKGLAKTSNMPGRTQHLVFFSPAGLKVYLVDMPGYGYAKAPKAAVASWTALVRDYLRGRTTLKRVFLLIDGRHGIKAEDERTMKLLDEAAVSYQLVLTKADKISPRALAVVREATAHAAARHPAAYPLVLATSAEKGTGIADLQAQLAVALRR